MDLDRFARMHCSVARAGRIVGDPWMLVVLRDLFLGLGKYEELRRDLGIATNVLADRLQRLVDEGLATKHRYQQHPPRDEYRLTEAGKDLYGVVLTVMAWGDKHRAPEGNPLTLIHADCSHPAVPTVVCEHCRGDLDPDAILVEPGPGGRAAPGTAVVAEMLTTQAGSALRGS